MHICIKAVLTVELKIGNLYSTHYKHNHRKNAGLYTHA